MTNLWWGCFEDCFGFLGHFRRNLAPRNLSKIWAEFFRACNSKWPLLIYMLHNTELPFLFICLKMDYLDWIWIYVKLCTIFKYISRSGLLMKSNMAAIIIGFLSFIFSIVTLLIWGCFEDFFGFLGHFKGHVCSLAKIPAEFLEPFIQNGRCWRICCIRNVRPI